MHSESRPGGCSYRNASLPCRGQAHDSGLGRGSVVPNKSWSVRRSLNLEASTSFDWKALIVTRRFELGIDVAGIDEHLLCKSVVDLAQTKI